MSFDFTFRPPWPTGAVMPASAADRITRLDPRAGCFSVRNTALFAQTVLVSMIVRIITPPLRPPFRFVNVETDSTANGRTEAGALPGYARARVEATVTVMDTSMRVLSPPRPNLFSSVDSPVFYGLGFPFSSTVFADTSLNATLSASVVSRPIIVDVAINSWAVAYGWASATADIINGCVTQIHVFSS